MRPELLEPLAPSVASAASADVLGARAQFCRAVSPIRNLRALLRPRSTSGRFGLLDGLRAWAVLHVLLFHTAVGFVTFQPTAPGLRGLLNYWVLGPLLSGALGVPVFFVLSGFLIAHVVFSELERSGGRFSFLRFCRRRWLRIAPAYCVAVLVSVAVNRHGERADCKSWWTNALFVNNFLPTFNALIGLEGVCLAQSWSIAVEVQLYLITPVLVCACHELRRRGRGHGAYALLATVAGTCVALRAWYMSGDALAHLSPVFGTELCVAPHYTYLEAAPYLVGIAARMAAVPQRRRSTEGEAAATMLANPVAAAEGGGGGAKQPVPAAAAAAAAAATACAQAAAAAPLLLLLDGLALANWLWWVLVGTPSAFLDQFAGFETFDQKDCASVYLVVVSVFGSFLFSCSVGWLLVRALRGHVRVLAWVLCWRVWRPIAALSYSAYLVQFLVIQEPAINPPSSSFSEDGSAGEMLAALLFRCALPSLLSVFLAALVLHLAVEKPVMNLRAVRWGRRSSSGCWMTASAVPHPVPSSPLQPHPVPAYQRSYSASHVQSAADQGAEGRGGRDDGDGVLSAGGFVDGEGDAKDEEELDEDVAGVNLTLIPALLQ